MNPLPLLVCLATLFISLLFVELSELILWRIYKPSGYLEALAMLEEYGGRLVELRRKSSRRAERKAALIDARLSTYRRFLVKVSFVRTLLYVLAYIGASGVLYQLFPIPLPAPAPLPVFTIPAPGMPVYTASQLALAALMFYTFRLSMPPLRFRRGGKQAA